MLAANLSPQASRGTLRVFISYATEDHLLADGLFRHLSARPSSARCDIWHKGLSTAGQDLAEESVRHLEEAELVVLMISADYLAVDATQLEMERAISRLQQRRARLLPIILRPVVLPNELATLQCLPANGAVSQVLDKDLFWRDVVQVIHSDKRLLPESRQEPVATSSRAPGRQSSVRLFVRSTLLLGLGVIGALKLHAESTTKSQQESKSRDGSELTQPDPQLPPVPHAPSFHDAVSTQPPSVHRERKAVLTIRGELGTVVEIDGLRRTIRSVRSGDQDEARLEVQTGDHLLICRSSSGHLPIQKRITVRPGSNHADCY